ncbi:MAG: hypothetical protein ACKOBW_15065 [Planctomycetota bacterium]
MTGRFTLQASFCTAAALALALLPSSWARGQAPAAANRPRPLPPGLLTVIPSTAEKREAFTDQIPLLELMAEAKDLEWTPNFIAKSETLLEKAKSQVVRREIWNLEFAFKPLRRINVDIPQPSGKMQRKQIWYMVYRVKNTGKDLRPKAQKDETYDHLTFDSETVSADQRRFLPQFVMHGRVLLEGKYQTKEYLDRIIPSAVEAIQAREVNGRKLLNTVEITRVGVPLSDEQNDRSVWGVVTWEDLDPRTDFFSVFIQGLTNAYQFRDTPGAYQAGDPPGKGRRFVYKTLQLNFHRQGDALLEHEEEIRYGVPLESRKIEQERLLDIYGLKEPLDHLWVYR